MRIGIDMLGVQSPHSRGRGIGRYAGSLTAAMIAAAPSSKFVLYAHDDLPCDPTPQTSNVVHATFPEASDREARIDRLARENPDALDVLLLLSPFEVGLDYAPPARPLSGLKLAAVVYDFLPFLHQERHLTHTPSAAKFYRNFERLRRYDRLLAISEATRTDALRLLGIRPDRVVNIRGASDPTQFYPAMGETGRDEFDALGALGVDRPYVFTVAGSDPRKNLLGLMDAFRLLRPELAATHQLVVTCHFNAQDRCRILREAENRGLAGCLVLTGAVPDATLRLLYQRCAVFAFPSLYEGFGLPILEAMHAGAPVLAGNNSSQIEVVGDAGLVVIAHDPSDIANQLNKILADRACAAELTARGIEHAKSFTWESTATLAINAIAENGSRRMPTRKPKIAVFSPFPPKASGIADYSSRLVAALRANYRIDIFHESGYEPDFGRESLDLGMFDHRLYDRISAQSSYHGTLYQMGNSLYHRYVYEALIRKPGLVTLHDFGLAGFHHGVSRDQDQNAAHFENELRYSHPDRAASVLDDMDRWIWNEGSVQDAFAARDLAMNRRIFATASRVLVHSPRIRDLAASMYPDQRRKLHVVPMGCTPRLADDAEKRQIRIRYGLPQNALIFASFGILHPSKMNAETIDAFAMLARQLPDSLLIFVGKDFVDGEAQARAEALGLRSRVRFLGRQDAAGYSDLIAATNVGICLRRPPTNGETSAALLDLLRHGVPTVVTATGTFLDYPADVVRPVVWPEAGVEGLATALLDLAHQHGRMGRHAAQFVAQNHTWNRCAEAYIEAIEAHASDHRRTARAAS